MRKLSVLFILLLGFTACKNDSANKSVIISGHIKNPVMNAVLIKGGTIDRTIGLDEDGSFTEAISIDSVGYFNLIHGRESTLLYLTQGDSLIINLDANNFNSDLDYKGGLANENTYLAEKVVFLEENTLGYPMLFSMEPLEFHQYISKLKSTMDELLDSTPNLHPEFIASERKSNYFDYLIKLQIYPAYHAYFTKNEDTQLPEAFTKPFEQFDYGNENYYKNFQSYKQLVINHYTKAILDNNDIPEVFVQLNKFKSALIKNEIAKSLSEHIKLSYENNKALFNGVMNISDDENFKKKLTAQYNKVKLLSKGMPSPKFNNYENHKGGKTSLDDLKGTYLYIDIWATWCAPCIQEIPYLKDLASKFKGKNIEFVSISIDRPNDYDTWYKMVNEKNLQGIQLLADKDWESNFIKQYHIIGIPRFIILDPDGTIVSSDAQRPSNPQLETLINDLIK